LSADGTVFKRLVRDAFVMKGADVSDLCERDFYAWRGNKRRSYGRAS
jgi:hypothetical protein